MSVPHTTTAPSSMVLLSSGTSAARFTVRAMPVPLQVGQAPSLLNASRFGARAEEFAAAMWARNGQLGSYVKAWGHMFAAVRAHVAADT